jgi:hypothetical protein
LEYNHFFDSAFEDLLSADSSTLCLGVSPEAIQPGYHESESFEAAHETRGLNSLDVPLEFDALQPGWDLTVDVDSASDYDFNFSNRSSLSFSDEVNTNDTTPLYDLTSLDRSGSILTQQASLSNSNPLPQSYASTMPYPPPAVDRIHGQSLPTVPKPSHALLSRCPLLKCLHCQQEFVDQLQLT